MTSKKRRHQRTQRQRRKSRHRQSERRAAAFDNLNIELRKLLADRLVAIRRPEVDHTAAPAGVLWQDDLWDSLILERGIQCESHSIEIVNGRQQLCHENCVLHFWLSYPKYRIATGYAFQTDMWVRHSWLMDGDTIVETTFARVDYFGVVLEAWDLTDFLLTSFLSILGGYGVSVQADPHGERFVLTLPTE